MFSFYSSISRLLSWNNTDTLTSKKSCSSLYPKVTEVINQVSPDSFMNKIISKNDVGEIIILEYPKYDKTFDHYKPKYF